MAQLRPDGADSILLASTLDQECTLSSTTLTQSRRRTLGALYPLLASAAWGVMYVVSKYSFGYIPPLTLCLIRCALGGGALVVILALRGQGLPTRRDWLPFLGLGLLVAVGLGTQYLGTDLATASQGALITTLTPVFTVFFAWLLGGEKLSKRLVLGSGAALAGVLIIISPQLRGFGLGSWRTIGGSLLLMTASLVWGLYTVLGKPMIRRLGALYTTAYSTLAGLPFFALCLPWELHSRPITAALSVQMALAILYLSLGATAAAWYLWNKGVEYVDASLVAVFFCAQPMVGALLGWLVLHETLGLPFLIGGAVVTAGILVVSK
jgi:drug/metabolite transporter (DMT)-like permease